MAKKRSRKRLKPEERMKDAKRWLRGGVRAMALIDAYMKRYAVERWIAVLVQRKFAPVWWSSESLFPCLGSN